jgi:hypothetical protein
MANASPASHASLTWVTAPAGRRQTKGRSRMKFKQSEWDRVFAFFEHEAATMPTPEQIAMNRSLWEWSHQISIPDDVAADEQWVLDIIERRLAEGSLVEVPESGPVECFAAHQDH